MLKFDDKGLIPVIVQDAESGDVLMLGYANEEALRRTLETGEVWFYSRSRQELWHKGETSGNVLKVVSLAKDCDGDAILVKANPAGPTCHTGERSCFFQEFKREDLE
ncbi:MAG: phosphoribosyl-AMP cyclohydrolase [Chloroflexi bacterium]|nr:phosphoribosyl-AMP cyclohydrolase [Chloroflexota bacterium]MBM3182836.1 phosphoribosyl-AMP cyclohydrolase [Chloroflexota bacterium]MBM4451839.1 phosphoribosyl-AMP cyclohydrolase [Chloroflexota bacterium]MBM4453090.1 phosphoribosyl-AMP cyclohydrolase [Chloroflexota bacterium]